MVAACPYCGVVLDPPPSRSRKCPDCRSDIAVRTDRGTGEKLYFTSDTVARFDAERAAVAARNKAMRRIEGMGLSEADYESKANELAEKWGSRPQPSDVYWTLANEQVMQLGDPRHSGQEIAQIYWSMALVMREEGRGHEDFQRRSHHARLTHGQATVEEFGAGWMAVVIAGGCCDVCAEMDGRTYTFEQALEEMPLPPEGCTRGWCTCMWANAPPD